MTSDERNTASLNAELARRATRSRSVPGLRELAIDAVVSRAPMVTYRMMEIAPGAFHLARYLSLERQRALVDECRALDRRRRAGLRAGRARRRQDARAHAVPRPALERQDLHVRADAQRFRRPAGAAAARRASRALARDIAASAGMTLDADLCILNYYDADGRMGLHQDKDESARSIAAGVPVVSVSLGDTARFLFGGLAPARSGRGAAARVGRRVRLRRPGAAAVSRRLAHHSRHRAAGARHRADDSI